MLGAYWAVFIDAMLDRATGLTCRWLAAYRLKWRGNMQQSELQDVIAALTALSAAAEALRRDDRAAAHSTREVVQRRAAASA